MKSFTIKDLPSILGTLSLCVENVEHLVKEMQKNHGLIKDAEIEMKYDNE